VAPPTIPPIRPRPRSSPFDLRKRAAVESAAKSSSSASPRPIGAVAGFFGDATNNKRKNKSALHHVA